MSINDAFVELGLAPGASEAEVKAAWRRLVSQWHPDRNASAEAAALMQRINGAYERIRLARVAAVAGAERGDVHAAGESRTRGAKRNAKAAGRTIQRRVRLAIEDIALGCTRVLRGRLVDTCPACEGSGRSREPQRCRPCKGSGRRAAGWWAVWPVMSVVCSDCEGSGTVQPACPACDGKGRHTTSYRCTVRLPAGLEHGEVLEADGGGAHRGGFDGTLELRIERVPHPLFAFGDDGVLRCEFPVEGFAWLAGHWIDVPTPTGMQRMQLRRGHRVYRLRGQGLPPSRGACDRGDYVVTVVPTFPETIDPEHQDLIERLAAMADAAPPPAVGSWRQRLRSWERGLEGDRPG